MTMRTVLHISCAILVLVQTAEGAGLGLPGLQEIMARWQTYQTNPTLLRIQPRKMMINNQSSAFKMPPPPTVKRKNANEKWKCILKNTFCVDERLPGLLPVETQCREFSDLSPTLSNTNLNCACEPPLVPLSAAQQAHN